MGDTFTRLTMVALRYLMVIWTMTGSFDRISCLNMVPHIIWVDDLRNCTEDRRESKGLRQKLIRKVLD